MATKRKPASAKAVAIEGPPEAAALHWAAGAIDKRLDGKEVPVGRTDLSGVKVVIELPDGAATERGGGTKGDGYIEATVAVTSVPMPSLAATLLFLQKIDAPSGANAKALWLEAIREAKERGVKAEELMPPEALKAAAEVLGQPVQGEAKSRKRTAAMRLGVDQGSVRVERVERADKPGIRPNK